MGELLNSIGGSKVSDTVFIQPDGTIKMNTIKPKLGKGLGDCKDSNRGKIFPCLNKDSGKDVDSLFSFEPVLLTNKKIDKKQIKINVLDDVQIPEINNLLDKFKTNSLIVRPDRFILASTKSDDLKAFCDHHLDQIYSP